MIAERTLSEWNEFVPLVDHLCGGKLGQNSFVFRGQGSEKFLLTPSFDRQVVATLKERNQKSKELIRRFRIRCEAAGMSCGSEDEWIGLAQHFGLPTRVLDWSDSPYVAAFFAVTSHFRASLTAGRPAVYVLDKEALEKSVDPDELRIFSHQGVENNRIRPQRGLFTQIKGDVPSLEQFLKERSLEHVLSKILFEKKILAKAASNLALMDISYERLFPGIDGIAQQIWFEFTAS